MRLLNCCFKVVRLFGCVLCVAAQAQARERLDVQMERLSQDGRKPISRNSSLNSHSPPSLLNMGMKKKRSEQGDAARQALLIVRVASALHLCLTYWLQIVPGKGIQDFAWSAKPFAASLMINTSRGPEGPLPRHG